MRHLEKWIQQYLRACEVQRELDPKTLKAYRIDLAQFRGFLEATGDRLGPQSITDYIAQLQRRYKPRTVKRKVASIKAFCGYLHREKLLRKDPFDALQLKLSPPFLLPRTIPLPVIGEMLTAAYQAKADSHTEAGRQTALRDVAVLELLFATGMRVSELCALGKGDVDLQERKVMIYGKGARERLLQIENPAVLAALEEYATAFAPWMETTGAFFLNCSHRRLSDQSVRRLVEKYASLADGGHITPHMFRHSFATLLLEEDVDIRYIQKLLGHTSIATTQIYTHVADAKQREILAKKHPRNQLRVEPNAI